MDLAEISPNKKQRSKQAYELQTGRWRSFLIRNNQQTVAAQSLLVVILLSRFSLPLF